MSDASPWTMVKVMGGALVGLMLIFALIIGITKGRKYLHDDGITTWEMRITVDSFGNKTTTCWESDWESSVQVQCDALIIKVEKVLANRRQPRMPQ